MTAIAEEPQTTDALVRTVGATIDFGREASNWDHAFRMAKVMANSSLVPKQYIGQPEDIVVAMQLGAEIGLRPMAALQSIAVINGKPSVYGDGFLAVIMASPNYVKHEEYYERADGTRAESLTGPDLLNDDTKSVSKFWRRGIVMPYVGTFSIFDAKRAKLLTKEGPWQQYTARQMRWRSREFAGRDGFAPELRGFHLAEALLDHDDPPVVTSEPVAPPTPQRRSEKATAAPMEPAADPPVEHPALVTELPEDTESRKATKAKPAKVAPPATLSGGTIEHVIITDTKWVPHGDEGYYQIVGRVAKKGLAPIGYKFITDSAEMFDIATDCAIADPGSTEAPTTYRATYSVPPKKDGTPGTQKVLDKLEAME